MISDGKNDEIWALELLLWVVFARRFNVSQYTGAAWTWWNVTSALGKVVLNQEFTGKPDQGWGSDSYSFTFDTYLLDESASFEAPVNRSFHCTDGANLTYYGPNSSLSSYDWKTTLYSPPITLNFTALQVCRVPNVSPTVPFVFCLIPSLHCYYQNKFIYDQTVCNVIL